MKYAKYIAAGLLIFFLGMAATYLIEDYKKRKQNPPSKIHGDQAQTIE
jgi:hypothetical protein